MFTISTPFLKKKYTFFDPKRKLDFRVERKNKEMSRKSINVEKVERVEMETSMDNTFQNCVIKGKEKNLIVEDSIIEGRISSLGKTNSYS